MTTRRSGSACRRRPHVRGAEWAEQARKIEDLGYSTLFMPDHFVDAALAPMVALPFAAAATTTLRIGMLVLGNDYKHPAVVAKEAATLDVLSDGRLEFGLGAGWMTADYDALGLPYDRAGVRIDRLAEALEVVKGAWADGPFDFAGEHYTITGVRRHADAGPAAAAADPRGRRRSEAAAPRRTRSRHRRHQPDPPRGGDRRRGGARHARRLDRPQDRVDPRGRGRPVRRPRAADPLLRRRDHRRRPRPRRGHGARASACRPTRRCASGAVLAGTVDEVCDTLVRRREEWGVSYVVFGDDQYEQFAPVVARLAGT